MKLSVIFVAVCLSAVSIFSALPTPTSLVRKVHRSLPFGTTISEGLSEKPKGGEATIATSTFNLAKSVIGAGVLSLPSGVAFLADEPSALIPAAICCTLFGIVAAYSFSTIGKVCKENDAKSFQEAWEKCVSPNSAWLISVSITALTFLASLAYSVILGDSFSALFQVIHIFFILNFNCLFL